MTKSVQDKETFLLHVRYLFLHRNIKFTQDRFNKEMKLDPSQIERVKSCRGRRSKGV
jgi:hypothetical protein